jgi:hypothetical protein
MASGVLLDVIGVVLNQGHHGTGRFTVSMGVTVNKGETYEVTAT